MGIIHAQISYQKNIYIKNLTSFKEVDRQQNQWIQDGQCDMCPEDLEESQRPMGPTDRLKSPVLQNFLQVQGTLTILPVMVEKKSNLRKRIMAMRKEGAFLEMCRSYGNLNPSKHLGNFHWNGLSWPINRQHNARIQGCFQCSTGYRSGFMLDKLGFVFSLVIDCLRMSYSLLSFSMLQNSCCRIRVAQLVLPAFDETGFICVLSAFDAEFVLSTPVPFFLSIINFFEENWLYLHLK